MPVGHTPTESMQSTLMTIYKNADTAKRLQLIILIWVDGKNASEAAKTLHIYRIWGPKWCKHYIRQPLLLRVSVVVTSKVPFDEVVECLWCGPNHLAAQCQRRRCRHLP